MKVKRKKENVSGGWQGQSARDGPAILSTTHASAEEKKQSPRKT